METSSMTASYIGDLFAGIHKPDDDYRAALYDDVDALSIATTAYTSQGECDGHGYPAGGYLLSKPHTGVVGREVVFGFEDLKMDVSEIEPATILIYNASKGGKSMGFISIEDLGPTENGVGLFPLYVTWAIRTGEIPDRDNQLSD